MTKAYIAGLTTQISINLTVPAYLDLEEVVNLSGLGNANDQLEVTNFDSNKIKEYIQGLQDGGEITIECNQDQTGAVQASIISAVDNRENVLLKFILTDGTDTTNFDMEVVCMAWDIVPAVSEATKVNFTLKVSSAIVIS